MPPCLGLYSNCACPVILSQRSLGRRHQLYIRLLQNSPRSRIFIDAEEPLPANPNPIRQRASSWVPHAGRRPDGWVLREQPGVCCGGPDLVGSVDQSGVWAVGPGLADTCFVRSHPVLADVGKQWGVDGSSDVFPAHSVCICKCVVHTVADGSCLKASSMPQMSRTMNQEEHLRWVHLITWGAV